MTFTGNESAKSHSPPTTKAEAQGVQPVAKQGHKCILNSSVYISEAGMSGEGGGVSTAHLVLEELPEWLNEAELQVLGKTANVMVALDGVTVLLTTARGWAALNDVRI
jgi:hypothetical protein